MVPVGWHGSIRLTLPLCLASGLYVGRGQQDRRLPAEPLGEFALCYAVNVTLEFDEDFEGSFGIERIAIGIEELRQGLAGDEELDDS
ncbi:hypothetical protein SPHINGOT1_340069 [Sphingomonas sp. T1]|nr:hypothetical protein SPHINGOT1_340069 [Sphingomonas sp. T1]